MSHPIEVLEDVLFRGKGLSHCYVNTTHVLVKQNKKPENVVLLHGVGGSALSFIEMIEPLSERANIFIVDLPGFGRSRSLDKTYTEVINDIIEYFNIQGCILCGHSFGAYLALEACSANVSKIVLLAPVGLYPTLGLYGNYWAVFYKLPVPLMVFCFLIAVMMSKYWFTVLKNSGNGIRHMQKYITFRNGNAYWNKPLLDKLKFQSMRTGIYLVYGENDSISPAHQGMIARSVIQKDTMAQAKLLVLENVGHNLMRCPAHAQKIIDFMFDNPNLISRDFGSSFFLKSSERTIHEFYSTLI